MEQLINFYILNPIFSTLDLSLKSDDLAIFANGDGDLPVTFP